MIAEARFLRATQYFYLASYFKDVPLVENVLTGEEANNVTKTSQADILKWCVTEFTAAAADLPRFSAIPAGEAGRACKQALLLFSDVPACCRKIGKVEQRLSTILWNWEIMR